MHSEIPKVNIIKALAYAESEETYGNTLNLFTRFFYRISP